jgi:PAS domain S-box-containing protein
MTESHEFLLATLESTADGILVVDHGGRTLFANRRFAEMWRIHEDLLGTGDDEAMLTFVLDQLIDAPAFLAKVHELYGSDEESFDTLRFKDGRVFERYSRALAGGNGDGEPSGRVWSFRDVTDRVEVEERLREAEDRYRTLVEQVPAAIYIETLDGPSTNIYISPQVLELTGYAQEEWIEDPDLWGKVIHPDDRDRELTAAIDHHRTGAPYLGEYRMFLRDGTMRWFRDQAVVVKPDGRDAFCHGVLYDITEGKVAEEALRLALTREREASEELRTLDEMKNTFLTAVSHELRTPLTSILGMALTLERQAGSLRAEDVQDLLARLASNARKLDTLLSDLLDLDRLRRGMMEPKRRPTDVGRLTRLAVESFELFGERQVTVDAPSIVISVEPAKVERIVENLLANSVRHTQDGTPVSVRVRDLGDAAMIVVEDEGPGIPERLRASVFEPFRQLTPDGSGSRSGVGIGLSLVARFAELHGGRAWVEEREGGGASFRVLIPDAGVAPQGRVQERSEATDAVAASSDEGNGSGLAR